LTPPALLLTEEASLAWREYHDTVERELGSSGAYATVTDLAAKSAENAARIAALLHVLVNGPTGEVSVEWVNSGAKIARWHLHEACRVLGIAAQKAEDRWAQELQRWLRQQKMSSIRCREIQRSGPACVRQRQQRDAAIQVLERL